jgi:hypothetical protein
MAEACMRIAGRQALVFIASDFHAPLPQLGARHSTCCRMHMSCRWWSGTKWSRKHPPATACSHCATSKPAIAAGSGCDRSSAGAGRTPSTQRRADLQKLFADRGMRPFYMTGPFDADALSRYFFEAV